MFEPKFWSNKGFLSTLLVPLSWFYTLYNRMYKIFKRPYKSRKFVICVGNITLGGAGKTPTVITISNYLQSLNYKIAIASRGYNGQNQEHIRQVSPEDNPLIVGDEPLLLCRTSACYIGKNKRILLKSIDTISDADIIIMDDGLQNESIYKDLKILVINGDRKINNSRVFPSGPFRETLKYRLKNVDCVITIGKQIDMLISENIMHFQGYLKICEPAPSPEQAYIAFAGIANPDKFFSTLTTNGYVLSQTIEYPDHHIYSIDDVNFLVSLSNRSAHKLITTEKDIVKIPLIFRDKFCVLKIELIIEEGGLEYIASLIQSRLMR